MLTHSNFAKGKSTHKLLLNLPYRSQFCWNKVILHHVFGSKETHNGVKKLPSLNFGNLVKPNFFKWQHFYSYHGHVYLPTIKMQNHFGCGVISRVVQSLQLFISTWINLGFFKWTKNTKIPRLISWNCRSIYNSNTTSKILWPSLWRES